MSSLKRNFIQLMNHALIFNHLSGSIYVNPLDHLELHLDLLPSLPYKKDGPLLHREGGLPPHKRGLVKADVDVSRVKSGRVQPAVSLTTLLIAPPVAFFCRASFAPPSLDEKGADL